jgi:hypothetical protein
LQTSPDVHLQTQYIFFVFTSLTTTQHLSMDEYFEEDHKNDGARDWSKILGNLQDSMKVVWRIPRRFQVFLFRKT